MNQSSSTENEQTIKDVGDKIDAQEQRKPRAPFDWRWLAGLSVLLFFASLFAFILVFGFLIREGQNKSNEERKRTDDIETCARRYATRVTNAQVDNNVALNNLVVYLGQPEEDNLKVAQLIADLETSTRSLESVRDARLNYERELTLPCPIEPLVPDR